MLKEARRLYDLGFAIHWLMPKSKRPILKKWTTGPRHTWAALEKSYKPGFNIGVRLGKASSLGNGYLAVVDCDVKSESLKHRGEMKAKLAELGLGITPTVISGRGNGSKHLYIRTAKPLAPRRYSQSPDKVKVLMPSVPPTKFELGELSEKDIKWGWRLRPAWEISLMGEGNQVVLPPSIHPDSGKAYKWGFYAVDKGTELVEFKDAGGGDATKIKREALQDWTPEVVDLISSTLPDEIIAQIRTGDGVEDRSAALYGVTIAMIKAGFTEHQILSVLTDNKNFLGMVGYDHAKTSSRKRAAEWVHNFTLKKGKKKASCRDDFEIEENYEVPEPSEKKRVVADSLLEVDDWRKLLERNQQDGRPKTTLKNLILIFKNLANSEAFVAHDEFAIEDKWLKVMPWGNRVDTPISDNDCRRIKNYLSAHFRMEPGIDKILEALLIFADENRFHPVREYISALRWDGVERCEEWLTTYLGATGPKEYLRAVGLKTLVAMVARVYEPGIKHDHVTILEGNQGAGKSTTARILSAPWFSDSFLNVNDKDSVMNMHGVWVNELGELSAMNRSEVNTLKEFVSRQVDKIRPPYGRLSVKFPRQNIFIGTTNNRDYLKDKTGNRRFWPIKIRRLKWKKLEADRDQLLAEAYAWYKLGEPLYMDKAQSALARVEQDLRMEHDELQDALADFLVDKNCPLKKEFTFFELLEDGPSAFRGLRNDRQCQMRVGSILRSLGYDNESKWSEKVGKNVRKWRLTTSQK